MVLPTIIRTYRRRALPVLATVCALAVPAAASAAFPGVNGSIAFDRGGSIMLLPAGGAAAALTPPGIDFAPAVSPSGKQVAYVYNRNVWVVNTDGTGKKQVTTDGYDNSDPAWSPDGTKVVYSGMKDGNPELYVKAVAGGTVTRLTKTPTFEERDPAFSPDGKKIAYDRGGCATDATPGPCVYVMNANGTSPVNLTPENTVPGCATSPGYYFNGNSKEPTWSPDGKKIAFVGPVVCTVTSIGSDVWVMDAADGRNKKDLTRDVATNDRQPAFSPDGTLIAFMSDRSKTGLNIFTMKAADGTSVKRVTTGNNDRRPDWGRKAQ
jgi:TolB protein